MRAGIDHLLNCILYGKGLSSHLSYFVGNAYVQNLFISPAKKPNRFHKAQTVQCTRLHTTSAPIKGKKINSNCSNKKNAIYFISIYQNHVYI